MRKMVVLSIKFYSNAAYCTKICLSVNTRMPAFSNRSVTTRQRLRKRVAQNFTQNLVTKADVLVSVTGLCITSEVRVDLRQGNTE